MRTIAVVVGSVMMFGLLFFIIPDKLRQIEIIEKGSKVPVIIESIPKKSWGKYKYYTFKYEGVLFTQKIGSKFGDLHTPGDTIYFSHDSNYPDVFVFPRSIVSYYLEIASGCLLSFLGLALILLRNKLHKKY